MTLAPFLAAAQQGAWGGTASVMQQSRVRRGTAAGWPMGQALRAAGGGAVCAAAASVTPTCAGTAVSVTMLAASATVGGSAQVSGARGLG